MASGSGGPAVHLARRTGCQVTGIDSNPNGVAVAQQAATRAGLAERLKFQVSAATRALPFGEASFDALLCIDSMNHFPDRAHSLAEWCRVLRPGGRGVHGSGADHGAHHQRRTGAMQRDELIRMEGETQFDGVQKFLGAVHRVTVERRLSRVAYFVEKA